MYLRHTSVTCLRSIIPGRPKPTSTILESHLAVQYPTTLKRIPYSGPYLWEACECQQLFHLRQFLFHFVSGNSGTLLSFLFFRFRSLGFSLPPLGKRPAPRDPRPVRSRGLCRKEGNWAYRPETVSLQFSFFACGFPIQYTWLICCLDVLLDRLMAACSCA